MRPCWSSAPWGWSGSSPRRSPRPRDLALRDGRRRGREHRFVRFHGSRPLEPRREGRAPAPHRLLLESALDELVFVVGPVLATLLATEVTESAGIVVPAVAAVVGGIWFLSQRRTEPPVVPAVPGVKHGSAMRSPGMIVLAVVFVAMGFIFGATDVSTIAFAEEQGSKSASGLILAVFAMGSLISGLAYGARHWVSPLWKRFAIGMVALALGVSLFFVVTSLPMLALVMFVTGFTIAPTLINGNALVQNLVTPSQLTEGLAWVGTSLGVGVSFGASIAGSRIDAAGAHAGFQVVMIAAGLAVVAVLASLGCCAGTPRATTAWASPTRHSPVLPDGGASRRDRPGS
ncbi:MFS transporter [Oerskovia sp. M15]